MTGSRARGAFAGTPIADLLALVLGYQFSRSANNFNWEPLRPEATKLAMDAATLASEKKRALEDVGGAAA